MQGQIILWLCLNKQQYHVQCDISNFTKITQLIWKRPIQCLKCTQWQSKRKLANEQTTEGVHEQYFLGLWLFNEQPEKQLECEILTQLCLNKQHCIQCEMNKRSVSKRLIVCSKGTQVKKAGKWTNKWENISSWNTNATILDKINESDIFLCVILCRRLSVLDYPEA